MTLNGIVKSEPQTPIVFEVKDYGRVIQARQASNSSWYNLTQVKNRVRAAARKGCDNLAIVYKKRYSAPELIPANIRGYYFFGQNPISFSKTNPNIYNVSASPQLVKISERVKTVLPDGKIISETSFGFICNGAYYNTNPGANN
jgi:hypothetical protein